MAGQHHSVQLAFAAILHPTMCRAPFTTQASLIPFWGDPQRWFEISSHLDFPLPSQVSRLNQRLRTCLLNPAGIRESVPQCYCSLPVCDKLQNCGLGSFGWEIVSLYCSVLQCSVLLLFPTLCPAPALALSLLQHMFNQEFFYLGWCSLPFLIKWCNFLPNHPTFSFYFSYSEVCTPSVSFLRCS